MAAKSWVREEEKKEKSKSRKNSPHDPDRKLRSSRLHPPSGPFFPRVHFSPLVLDPPRVLLRGVGILLMRRDALPERERRAGCELFARLVEGCPPREQKRATSDGASTAFPFPPLDHVIRPVPFHQKNTRPELCTTESQRLAAARSVIIPVVASAAPSFILLSFVRHFSAVSSLPFLSSERDRSRSAESVRSFGLSSILPRFAPSLRLIHRSFLSLSLSLSFFFLVEDDRSPRPRRLYRLEKMERWKRRSVRTIGRCSIRR